MFQKYSLSTTTVLGILSLILIGFLYVQFLVRAPHQFFSRLPNQQNMPLTALERPNVSTKALLSWVTLAATSTFTIDFYNYEQQLAAMHEYFTADGFDNFMASLTLAGTLDTIQAKKLILSAVAIGPAIILEEDGQTTQKHSWRIQVPLIVRYQSANVDETRTQVVEVLVTQVPTQDAPKGIGIAQYIAREVGPEVVT